MENSENYNGKTFKGAGYFLGSLVSVLLAIGIFIYSQSFVLALAASLPIGTTLGLTWEQRFQSGNKLRETTVRKVLVGLLVLGLLVFILFTFLR